MSGPLGPAARAVAARPVIALAALVVLSAGIGAFALRLEQRTDFDAYAPEGPAAATLADIEERFGSRGVALQVLIDAGEDGDVVSPEGLAAAERIATAATQAIDEPRSPTGGGGDAEPGAHSDREAPDGTTVSSYATALNLGLERLGDVDPDDATTDRVAGAVLDSAAGEQLAGLLSQDLRRDGGVGGAEVSARAGLGIVALPASLDGDELTRAAVDVRNAIRALEIDGVEVAVFGQPLLEQASGELVASELPRLLGFSLLLITLVLAVVFRRIADVAVGLVGLALALVWTYGLGALLGPGWLGWVGPFNQITTVVPVLVAGLGIDFALHLTTRTREERSEHDPGDETAPRRASRVAVLTVGGALALTTLTTAVGFATNLASPLAPVRDFGVLSAVGVASAFAVMIVIVPASDVLIGRWRARRGQAPASGRSGPIPAIGAVARFSTAHPAVVLVSLGLVSVAAVVAATFVPTTFSTDDFIPDGSDSARALDRIEDRFGADVSERTEVLLRGDLTAPDVVGELANAPSLLGSLDGVRSGAGRPLVRTPFTLAAELAARSPELEAQLERAGFTVDGLRSDPDAAQIYEVVRRASPDRGPRFIGPDAQVARIQISSSAGQGGAERLVGAVDAALEPLRDAGVEVAVSSQQLVFARTVDTLASSQLSSIAITVGAAALLLVGYFWYRMRSVVLGLIAMVPTLLVAAWVVGTMWVLGLSFNVLTITIGSLAIAIGVDYGIHIAYRFREELDEREPDDAIETTARQTGGALPASAVTTAVGFGVLTLSSITPIRQFGVITALTIVYSVIVAVLVMPAVLHLWALHHERSPG